METINKDYKEILKLDEMLTAANIPHTLEQFFDGWQVCYPTSGKGRVMDAVEHCGSYGHNVDLLEIMGLLTEDEVAVDDVVGYLTAEDVFERIKTHYTAQK